MIGEIGAMAAEGELLERAREAAREVCRARGDGHGGRKRDQNPRAEIAALDRAVRAWAAEVRSKLEPGSSDEDRASACEAVLRATRDENAAVLLSNRDMVDALIRRAAVDPTTRFVVMELLLTSNPRKLAEASERFCASIDEGFASHLRDSFFESSAASTSTRAIELDRRTWCLVPQLMENLKGTSRTRGEEGRRVHGERLRQLCEAVESAIAEASKLGSEIPPQESRRIAHVCDEALGRLAKLLGTRYTFQTSANVGDVLRAMGSYFAFLRGVLASRRHGESCLEVASGLRAILGMHRALLGATTASIMIWADPLISQLNHIAKLSLSRPLLLCESREGTGDGLVADTMETVACWIDSHKSAAAMKLNPHALAVPLVALVHLSRGLGGPGDRTPVGSSDWARGLAHKSFNCLSSACACSSPLWPDQEMQGAIGSCLVDACGGLVQTLGSAIAPPGPKAKGPSANRSEIDALDALCCDALMALDRMCQCQSSPVFCSLRGRAEQVAREASGLASRGHLPGLARASDSLLQGLRSLLRPRVLSLGGEEVVLGGMKLPDILSEVFEHHRAASRLAAEARAADPPTAPSATFEEKKSEGEEERRAPAMAAEPAKREREEERGAPAMAAEPAKREREEERGAPVAMAMAAEPAKKARLPHPTTTTDYGDLLSDSDEGSLSIDSGGM